MGRVITRRVYLRGYCLCPHTAMKAKKARKGRARAHDDVESDILRQLRECEANEELMEEGWARHDAQMRSEKQRCLDTLREYSHIIATQRGEIERLSRALRVPSLGPTRWVAPQHPATHDADTVNPATPPGFYPSPTASEQDRMEAEFERNRMEDSFDGEPDEAWLSAAEMLGRSAAARKRRGCSAAFIAPNFRPTQSTISAMRNFDNWSAIETNIPPS